MMVLGVDAHKDSHTAAAVDQVGAKTAQVTVRARDGGHDQLISWARRQCPGQRLWAVEDCRHVTGRLETALLAAGERVVRVPPQLTAGRRASRARGKSDAIDARTIARAALAEPDLPVAEHCPATRELKLLSDRRDQLVAGRTRDLNRLRWQLHDLDPDLEASLPARELHRPKHLTRIQHWLDTQPATVLTRLAAELAADIATATQRITALERELADRVAATVPALLAIPGVAAITAAKIAGETANPDRFRNEACFAMHAGVAPVPASSGRTRRNRLNRGGNRQLNAALHRVALTQIRLPSSAGHAYYHHRLTQKNNTTPKEALRALKRHIARTVYRQLRTTTPAA